jgi:large subunit ribosomal protein L7/L12
MRDEEERVDAILAQMRYDRKIDVIKLVREVTGLSLAEGKDFIEHLPQTLKRDISEEEAWKLHDRFAALGAHVNTRPSSRP